MLPLRAARQGAFSLLITRELLLQQNRHRSIAQVRRGEIEFSISIEICYRDLVRVLLHRIRRTCCLRERPIALPKQKRDCPISIVCDRKVQFAVAIEISRYDRVRTISNRDRCWRPKGSIAISEQDDHRVASGIGHREIELAITVKVAGNDRGEALPEGNGRTTRWRECPVALPKRHSQSRNRIVGEAVCNNRIRLSVRI